MKLAQLLTLITLNIITTSFSQHFGIFGSEWYYSEHGDGLAPLHSEYLHAESVLDTIIEGKTTHKIIQTSHKFDGSSVNYNPIYVYEAADTVFRYNFSLGTFTSLYIFNGEIGDTLLLDKPDTLEWTGETYRLVIDTITTTMLDGVLVKKYKTTALDDYSFHNGGYFMDLAGGLDWFFPRSVIFPEEGGPIRCHRSPIVDTTFWDKACDYREISSIVDQERESFRIYPNPFTDFTTIDLNNLSTQVTKIEIYDVVGHLIYARNLNGEKQIRVNSSELEKGIYLVHVVLENGTTNVYTEQLIVN